MIESIMQVASGPGATRPPLVVGPRDAALRLARTCYDHLAGRLGVALADALTGSEYVELASDGGLVTDRGVAFFAGIGIDVDALMPHRGKRSPASYVGHALIGANDGLTLLARLGRRSAHTALPRSGFAASRAPARSRSHRKASGFFANISVFRRRK